MSELNAEMMTLIRRYSLGAVATVNADGSPAVSPKATFVVVDSRRIAYGNIRSPGTQRNLDERPAVEVLFCDVLARLAVRVRGKGRVVSMESDEGDELRRLFDEFWAPYLDVMHNFVAIDIEQANLIRSPGYDVGFNRDELVRANIDKLSGFASE